jgi:hypothetical protein
MQERRLHGQVVRVASWAQSISQFDLSLKNTQSISAVAIFACQLLSDVFIDPLPHG